MLQLQFAQTGPGGSAEGATGKWDFLTHWI